MTTVPPTSAACNFLLVCGASAAGKSTFAKEFAKEFSNTNASSESQSGPWHVVEGDFVHNPPSDNAADAGENSLQNQFAQGNGGAPGLHPWSDLKTLLPTSREFCEGEYRCSESGEKPVSLMSRTNAHIANHVAKLAAAGVSRNFVVPFCWWTRASRLDMAKVALPRAFAALKKKDDEKETGVSNCNSKDSNLDPEVTVTVRTAWLECVDSEIKGERMEKRAVFWTPEALGCTPAEFDAFEEEVEQREREKSKTPRAEDDSVDMQVDSSGPGRGSGSGTSGTSTTQTGPSGDSEKEKDVEVQVRPTYNVVSIRKASGQLESCGLRAAEKLFH